MESAPDGEDATRWEPDPAPEDPPESGEETSWDAAALAASPADADATLLSASEAPASQPADDRTQWEGAEDAARAAPDADATQWSHDPEAPAGPAFLAAGRPGQLTPGTRVDDYEVLAELGQGGMGTVFRARRVEDDVEVALKVPTFAKLSDGQRRRFEREGEIARGLEHPGIVRLLDAGEHRGTPYLVYELVEGGRSFKEVIRTATLRRRVELLANAGRALGHAHEEGVVHRDVKPDNLLVDAWGTLRVADFGLAASIDLDRLTATGSLVGTPRFMAPEQIEGRRDEVGPPSDVWSLGVLLYLSLTNQLPFDGVRFSELMRQIVREEPTPIQRRSPRAPSSLVAVCQRALAKEPTQRYADGGEFAHALLHAVASTPPAELDRASGDKRGFRTRRVGRERSTRRLAPGRVKLTVPSAEPSDPTSSKARLDRVFETGTHPVLDHLGPGRRRVRDPQLCREVELHLLQPGQAPESFERRARVLAQLDHPAIPKVHRLGSKAYSTELLEGQTLFDLFAERSLEELGLQALLRAFLEVCAGVVHAHGRGLLHSEIGPHRVVLGSFGRAWIQGWGGARAARNSPEVVRRATALPPLARAGRAPCLAPEVERAGDVTVRTDVWGLGAVLRWILVQSLPPESIDPDRERAADVDLLAIARKATASEPGSRYADVASLADDVRRYLDGRSVEATSEGLLRACRRLARNHPLPAAVAACVGVLLVGLGALTVHQVRSQLRSAELARERAAALRLQHAQSDAIERESQRRARTVRELTRAWNHMRVAVVETQSRISQGADDAEIEERFAKIAAQAAPWRERIEALVANAEDPSLAKELQELSQEARWAAARLERMRGEHRLYTAKTPDAALALERFRRQAQLTPEDPRAWRAQLVAARNVLPGDLPEGDDPQAKLATFDGPLGQLARLIPQVERAESLVTRGQLKEAAEVAALPLRELESLIDTHDPLVWELLARAHLCSAALPLTERTRKQQDHYHRAAELLTELARLDPASTEPRVLLIQSYDRFHGTHTFSRLPSGFQFAELERVVRQQAHPEPILELATELQRQLHVSASLPFTERLLALGPRHHADRRRWLRLQLAHARACLSAGREVDVDLDGLELPSAEEDPRALQWRAQRELLRAHLALLAGRAPAATESLIAGVEGLERSLAPGVVVTDLRQLSLARLDLRRACLDPRIEPAHVVEALNPLIAGIQEAAQAQGAPLPPTFMVLVVLRAYRGAQAGVDVDADLRALGELAQQDPGLRTFLHSHLAGTLVDLARARRAVDTTPTAATHRDLLFGWANVNLHFHPNERFSRDYQRLVVRRLRARGAEDAAKQFAELDALDELWVRRLWVSELHAPDPELKPR